MNLFQQLAVGRVQRYQVVTGKRRKEQTSVGDGNSGGNGVAAIPEERLLFRAAYPSPRAGVRVSSFESLYRD